MNKWYQGIVVNHKEEEGKLSHWFDDENYKILCEERVEQLKEIERLNNIIKEALRKLRATKDHYKIEDINNAIIYTIRILERSDKVE